MKKIFSTVLIICLVIITCTSCNKSKNIFKNGTYVSVEDSDKYVTIKDNMITLDNPKFGDDINETYHTIVYFHRYMDYCDQGLIPTQEDEDALKKDIPDFNPDDYIGKTYTLDFMNEETYVKGDVCDIMLWYNDEPIEILSGELNLETGILTIGGADYKLEKH